MKSQITLVVPLGDNSSEDFRRSINKKSRLQVIVARGKNPSANRNQGIKKSKTPFIAFINGHSFLSKDWESQVALFFKKYPNIDVVGGPQLNSELDNFFGKISGYALASRFGSGGIWRRYGGKKINLDATETEITSSNLICRKRVFKKVKFDESLYPGEDPKFIADLKSAGFKVAYSPDIKVANKRRTNILALSKQVFDYGKVRPQKESFLDTLKKPFFLVPSVFVLYLLSLLVYHSWFYLLPIYLYILLSLIYTLFLTARHNNPLSLILLPLIFISIHISYGLGMIYGMARIK